MICDRHARLDLHQPGTGPHAPKSRAANRMPNGLARPSKATAMASKPMVVP